MIFLTLNNMKNTQVSQGMKWKKIDTVPGIAL
jgi:hypothetical protein